MSYNCHNSTAKMP